MHDRPFRDVLEELEARELTPGQFAQEAGIPVERLTYWIALAELKRRQETAVSGGDTCCSL